MFALYVTGEVTRSGLWVFSDYGITIWDREWCGAIGLWFCWLNELVGNCEYISYYRCVGIYMMVMEHLWFSYLLHAATAAKSLQSCPTLCDPVDGSPPGSPVPGIPQARVLEWGAITVSNAWKWKVKVKSFSRVQLFATPFTAAYQTPLSMGFSRQEWVATALSELSY